MTLQNLFDAITNQVIPTLVYFIGLPVLAAIIGFIGGTKDNLSPWKYFYTAILYLVSVPGIFAVGLNIYLFLFERQPIMQTDLLLQVLPIISMIVTVLIIRNNVLLEYVPGFNKISGLWFILFTTMFLMWLMEKIHIVVFSFMPFQYLLGVFVLVFAGMYWGWLKLKR